MKSKAYQELEQKYNEKCLEAKLLSQKTEDLEFKIIELECGDTSGLTHDIEKLRAKNTALKNELAEARIEAVSVTSASSITCKSNTQIGNKHSKAYMELEKQLKTERKKNQQYRGYELKAPPP